jgi:hypothetical protein
MAEREGFEPSIGLTLRRISSAVHSTTLPPLRRPAFYNFSLVNTRSYLDHIQNYERECAS